MNLIKIFKFDKDKEKLDIFEKRINDFLRTVKYIDMKPFTDGENYLLCVIYSILTLKEF